MRKGFASVFFIVTAWAILLNASIISGYHEIKGTAEDFPVQNYDGNVDFSLVMPASTSEELVNFELSRVVSPSNDTVKVLSYTFDVPSNLVLPTQEETYFFTITLDKPEFRTYLPTDGTYNLYAIRGTIPLKKMINAYQNKESIFTMLNYATFGGGGNKTIKVKGPTSGVAIPVDAWNFNKTLTVKAPTVAKDKVMLSLAMFKDKGEFFATDLKMVPSGQSQQLLTRSQDTYVVSVLMPNVQPAVIENFDGNITAAMFGVPRAAAEVSQLSMVINSTTSSTSPQFLPVVAVPKYQKAGNKVTATPPSSIKSINPMATLLVLSEVEEAGNAQVVINFKKALWSQAQMGWATEFDVSAAAGLIGKNKKHSWDVIYVGSPDQLGAALDYDKITHITRNSLKF